MWMTSSFYWYENETNTYSYKRQEFQNILERKLCNRFEPFILIYQKEMLNMALRTLYMLEICSRFNETLQYKQIINWQSVGLFVA